ncbi:aspartyl protease family protein [Dysgonomonas sp. UBA7698]|uniref:aspartyl protease family protein n=1 Tax=Dysgonomonas sp. UBA7698 TaxID=1946427 RepID=UPI0025C53DB4|nr:aspartyl protease family protein [Dysgonomonas sp. UBA7698]
MKKLLLYISILLLPVAAKAQGSIVSKHDTVRFELVQNKIIIPATLDGRATRFIIDTGGRNLITGDSAEYHNVEVTARQLISDVNSGSASMFSARAKELQLGPGIHLEAVPMLVAPPNNFFRELGVAGLLGSEAFSKVCLTIDKRAGHIVMSYPYRPRGLPKDDAMDIPPHKHWHPYIPIRIGGQEIHMLFDTGMDGFLNLTGSDFRKLADNPFLSIDNEGYGFLNVGIGGIDAAQPEKIELVRVAGMSFAGKCFENVVATSQKLGGNSIIGIGLLDYGRLVLDYPRAKIYFLPYEAGPTDLGEVTRIWNVKIMPIADHFEITAVFGDLGVELGDRVWAIGEIQLEGAELSELYINRLLGKCTGDICQITVGVDKDNLRVVTIRKL